MESLSSTYSRAGLLMWTVVLLYVPESIASVSMCAAVNMPSVIVNTSLSIGVFDVLYTRGLALCARECKYRKRCLSFNYETNIGECQLNGNANSSTTLIAESTDGFSYSEANTWPESIAGRCGNKPCPGNSVCVLDDHGYYCTVKYCITPVSPYFDEHVIPEFDQSVGLWPTGTNLTYICSPSYYPSVDWTCNTNGTWEKPVCKALKTCTELLQCNPVYLDGNYVFKYPDQTWRSPRDNKNTKMVDVGTFVIVWETDHDMIVQCFTTSHHTYVRLQPNTTFSYYSTNYSASCHPYQHTCGYRYFTAIRIMIYFTSVWHEQDTNFTTTDCDGPRLFEAGKNYHPGCEIPEPGMFQVDLRGTGLKHDLFTSISGQVVFSDNDQLVTYTCDTCTCGISPLQGLSPAIGSDINYTNTTIPVCLSRS